MRQVEGCVVVRCGTGCFAQEQKKVAMHGSAAQATPPLVQVMTDGLGKRVWRRGANTDLSMVQ